MTQLDIFEFTNEVPLETVLNLKTNDIISMVIGSPDNDYKSDILLESSEFIKVYDMFSRTIDSNNLRNVYVKIRFNSSEHEVSVPLLLVKKVYSTQSDADHEPQRAACGPLKKFEEITDVEPKMG